ncbi:MAG: DUF2383 domain-containing protein [Akkermansiaceae bacterium]|nr:DUF2383 domain-containing protein [Akkermansiaceae bacterium]NNM28576.1 DUF2383 domain-containing protein [Akkermansiaceae bacterium]
MNQATTTNKECIDVCNSLLRGERSAVETYDKAIEKFGSEHDVSALRSIRNDHSKAVSQLMNNVRDMGGTPDVDSGAWGTFANAVQATANLFGTESALESLEQGEKKGRSDYQDALENDDVLPECKAMIRNDLLPKIEQHLGRLKQLQDEA